MKKLMVALLILVAFGNIAMAQETDMYIGIFADDAYTHCYADVEAFAPVTIYLAAFLDEEVPGITAAEFGVDNWQGTIAGTSMVTMAWNTDLVIGTVEYGVALAFSTPIPGPFAFLGTATVLSMDAAWLADETLMTVVPATDSGMLQVVDGDFAPHDVNGGTFTYNCVNPAMCSCFDEFIAADATNWSSLKALY
ncbi:MAG: hypothetical protein GY835_07025 [bacterium]|nr:hypothetical protein [bacterium]